MYGLDITENMLVIDRIEIAPEYRGMNIGMLALCRAIQQFRFGASIAVIKPFPLQYEGKQPNENETKKYKNYKSECNRAIRKLEKHYGKIGFKKVEGTQLMTLNLDGENTTMEELGASSCIRLTMKRDLLIQLKFKISL